LASDFAQGKFSSGSPMIRNVTPPELRLIVFHMMIGISGNKRIRNGELIGTR